MGHMVGNPGVDSDSSLSGWRENFQPANMVSDSYQLFSYPYQISAKSQILKWTWGKAPENRGESESNPLDFW